MEMQSFFYLFTRYLAERAKGQEMCVNPFSLFFCILTPNSDWDRIKAPAADQIVSYDSLPDAKDTSNLGKLAVLKVNGGLGTSMGKQHYASYALYAIYSVHISQA